eukprot:Pgem_evm3s3568
MVVRVNVEINELSNLSNEQIAQAYFVTGNHSIDVFPFQQRNYSPNSNRNFADHVINLNISPSYMKNITGFDYCRELIQNWFDGCIGHIVIHNLNNIQQLQQHNNLTYVKVFNLIDDRNTSYGYLAFFTKHGHNYIQMTNFNTELNTDVLVAMVKG